MKTSFSMILCSLLLIGRGAEAAETHQQQLLQEAHALFHSASNSTMFAEAAEQYEFLIHEEKIQNGPLFYTAGNSWFMAGEIGRALLNYRRAELFMPGDADLQHNLKAAQALRQDRMTAADTNSALHTVFRWHFTTSPRARWIAFGISWVALWSCWLLWRRGSKRAARPVFFVLCLPAAVLMLSLAVDAFEQLQRDPGVVIADEVLARKGNGDMYAPAFMDPLHAGTEFDRIEARDNWWHIRLADGQRCWIPAEAAETVWSFGQ